MVMGFVELLKFHGFMNDFEEGVNHGKRRDDETLCAMVMGFLELLIFRLFYVFVFVFFEEGVNQGSGVV